MNWGRISLVFDKTVQSFLFWYPFCGIEILIVGFSHVYAIRPQRYTTRIGERTCFSFIRDTEFTVFRPMILQGLKMGFDQEGFIILINPIRKMNDEGRQKPQRKSCEEKKNSGILD